MLLHISILAFTSQLPLLYLLFIFYFLTFNSINHSWPLLSYFISPSFDMTLLSHTIHLVSHTKCTLHPSIDYPNWVLNASLQSSISVYHNVSNTLGRLLKSPNYGEAVHWNLKWATNFWIGYVENGKHNRWVKFELIWLY